MAEAKQEISILQDGMTLNTPVNKSVWIQNFFRNQAQNWETRDGFGVLAEFNSSLVAREFTKNSAGRNPVTSIEVGLQICLGAYLIHTTFGHDQIVSVFLTKGNITGDPTSQTTTYVANDYDYFYSVVIYDVTTNNFWEQILYTHTSEFATQTQSAQQEDVNNSFNHGYYEARADNIKRFHTIKEANKAENEVWFAEFQDRVYFGSTDFPTFVYEPAIFRTPRAKFIRNILNQTEVNDQESNPYSEESLVFPLALKDGQFTEAYTYIQQSQLPNFTSATYIANRMVYSAGKTLYFSDPNNPNSIIGEESYTLDLEDDIVAIKAWNNNILVWSTFETAVYQPSLNSSLLSGGTHIITSHKIGILNNACFCTTDDGVYWSNGVGVYFTANCFDKQEVSTSIGLFFTDYAINPLTYYFNQSGAMNPSTSVQNPSYSYKLFEGNNTKFAHMLFDPQYRQIIFVVPKLNLAWVLNKGWYLWNFESSAFQDKSTTTSSPSVGITNNISQPKLVCRDNKIYSISGKKSFFVYEPYAQTSTDDVSYVATTYNSSFVFSEWKRGGGLDRSSIGTYLEDWKYNAGYAKFATQIATRDEPIIRLFFDKLIPKRGKFSSNVNVPEALIDDRVFMLPIRLTPNNTSALGDPLLQLTTLTLEFYIDHNNWLVIGDFTGAGNAAAVLPTERVWSKDGFGIGAPVAGSQVTYDNATGKVIIKFDIANVVNANFNGINLNTYNKNNLIYIPIKQITTTGVSLPTNSPIFKITGFSASFITSRGLTTTASYNAFVWENGYINYNAENADAQAVDWAFKSGQFGLEDAPQIKSRGTYATLVSRGSSQDPIVPTAATFPYGLYNSIAGSDYKDYVTQLVDVTSTAGSATDIELITNKNTTRNRAVNSSGVLTNRNFNNGFTFGDTANIATGNYLVDAQEVDTISTSDSVRGEQINYTIFGFIRNKAEKIILNTLRAVVFAVGGRRRRGR